MSWDDFDVTPHTTATERMRATITYEGLTPGQVFEVVGDPDRITDWMLLAEDVRIHPAEPGQDPTFNVVFAFFGDVYEEVLHWDPPARYVYLAQGPQFPIKDYIGRIEVHETGPGRGEMIWAFYYDRIEPQVYEPLIPLMLPPIIEASVERLAPLIGGTKVRFESFM